jgi:hypothetical protein
MTAQLFSARGCPYGCEFCTVTGFFGDSIRFRTNESVVDELLRLKARAKETNGKVAIFFVDDNFAINIKRTKSLLRAIIAANAQLAWVGQISANLLRDEELVDLIAESGGKWVFIGMESLDPANLKDVNKSFNKPAEFGSGVLWSFLGVDARRNLLPITKAALRLLDMAQLRRVTATTPCDFGAGCRWLSMLGFQVEGAMRSYAPDGRDHFLYARIR